MAAFKKVMCPACDGNGKLPFINATTKCGLCNGTGEILCLTVNLIDRRLAEKEGENEDN